MALRLVNFGANKGRISKMLTFKSSIFILIKNVFYGVVGGAVAALIASYFLDLTIAIAIGVVLGLLIIFFTLFSDNIKVVVGEGDFTVFRRGKARYSFKLSEVGFHARIRTKSGDSDCKLTVEEANGNKTYIDCSMLGASRFYRLLDALHVTDSEPTEIKTTKEG
jgi:hypothetical protein